MDIPESHLFDFDPLDRETIEAYIADLREAPPASELEARLNDERERARRQCVRGVHEWVQTGESEVATLTLPTGLGKTFTGLSAAFELRDSLADRETAESARQIIYALHTRLSSNRRGNCSRTPSCGAPTQREVSANSPPLPQRNRRTSRRLRRRRHCSYRR